MLPISGDHSGVGPVGLLMEVEQNLLEKKSVTHQSITLTFPLLWIFPQKIKSKWVLEAPGC